ncbi:hypothetical protein GCM10027020_10410 [Nocardioides salsibiostraticola]
MRAPKRTTSVISVLVLAFLATAGTLVLVNHEREKNQSLIDAGRDAQVAAEAAVVQMTTYDYRTVDSDFEWVDNAGTDTFQENFQEASADAVTIITELQASARGTVIAAAPQVTDEEHVAVLLFVDQEITSVGEDSSKIDQPRVTMEMVLDGDRWLVDAVSLGTLIDPAGS